MLTLDDYKSMADKITRGVYYPLHDMIDCEPLEPEFFGEVVAKERQRSGKGGRMYTPTKTRKFEAAVREWGSQWFTPVYYPICVRITVHDQTDDGELLRLSSFNIAYKTTNDLDNICKSILDGLNKVLYKDDRQIVKLIAERRYAQMKGFTLQCERAGLSKHEVEQLRKHLK